ncbi:hypothetical protein VNO77_30234 [Canavalia gladiata]|uniref:Uncharacterized protein n=1 Tax=Canavalia gladiata TaxID=3824 RepID=A0AAN9KMT0_CANGL
MYLDCYQIVRFCFCLVFQGFCCRFYFVASRTLILCLITLIFNFNEIKLCIEPHYRSNQKTDNGYRLVSVVSLFAKWTTLKTPIGQNACLELSLEINGCKLASVLYRTDGWKEILFLF